MARPKVTQAEFDQLACNNCGACCEILWLPGPLEMAQFLSAGESARDATPEWRLENERFIRWLSALEPTGRVMDAAEASDEGYTHQYRCSRFKRREDGSGYCSAYEDRPSACRGFPYGQPVRAEGFEACSWNVEIVEDSTLRKGRRVISSALKASRRLLARVQAGEGSP